MTSESSAEGVHEDPSPAQRRPTSEEHAAHFAQLRANLRQMLLDSPDVPVKTAQELYDELTDEEKVEYHELDGLFERVFGPQPPLRD